MYSENEWNIRNMFLDESQVLLPRFAIVKKWFLEVSMETVGYIKNLIAPLDRAHRVVLGT